MKQLSTNKQTFQFPLNFRGMGSILAAMVFSVLASSASAQCFTSPGVPNITGNVPFGPPINWANPNRIEVSDDLYARVTMDAGETSKLLEVRDFGFVLPAGATILGITVLVEGNQELGGNFKPNSLHLMKGGMSVGDDKAGLLSFNETTDQTTLLGSPSDTWGETWTAADIMDPFFGLLIDVTRTAGPPNLSAHIDYLHIIIYFDDGSGCILPIEMQSFTAREVSSGTVVLDWSTASETMNDYFTVERSTDGMSFTAVGSVDGSGTTTSTTNYTYTDSQLSAATRTSQGGELYYRIRQTDLSGSVAYSEVVKVTAHGQGPAFVAGPNPASELVTLTFSEASSAATIELLSLDGRLVMAQQPADGTTQLTVDVSNLDAGLYLLRMRDGSGAVTTSKLIVN